MTTCLASNAHTIAPKIPTFWLRLVAINKKDHNENVTIAMIPTPSMKTFFAGRITKKVEKASGPVSRILFPPEADDDHSSWPRITAGLMRPTRRCDAPSRCVSAEAESLPIWSCSVWGLPCPEHYCPGGALLPHLFTLIRLRRTVCFLWHWPSSGFDTGIPDVIRHTALRSSDFPPLPQSRDGATVRSTGCIYDSR
jgi:hypothetical protein